MAPAIFDLSAAFGGNPIKTRTTNRVADLIEVSARHGIVCAVIGTSAMAGVTTAVQMAFHVLPDANPLMLTMTDFDDGRFLQEQLMHRIGVPALRSGNTARLASFAARMLKLKGVRMIALDRADMLVLHGEPNCHAISFLASIAMRMKIGIAVCGRTGVEIFAQALSYAIGPPAPFIEVDNFAAQTEQDIATYGGLLKILARNLVQHLGLSCPDATWLLSDDAASRFLLASRGNAGMTAYLLRLGVDRAIHSKEATLMRQSFDLPWRDCCAPYEAWGANFPFAPFSRAEQPSLTEIRNVLRAEPQRMTSVELPKQLKGKGARFWGRK